MLNIHNNDIYILPTLEDLFLQVAEDFTHRANTSIQTKGEFTVVLSGGNTPKLLLTTLADERNSYRNRIPWDKIKFFFGDERYVPLDNIESNYHMAYQYLFSKVPVLASNIYRIPTEFINPALAAKDYEKTLRSIFDLKDNEFPNFDLVYLGLGEDGHTASLMPQSDVVIEYCKTRKRDHGLLVKKQDLLVALLSQKTHMYRISFTPDTINNAANVIFLVTGPNKKSAVKAVLEGPLNPELYPAQLIHCLNNPTIWYLDKTAASELTIYKEQKDV